jgi:hypothetical protein
MSKCGSKAQRKRIPDGGKHTCCYANLMVMGPKKTPVQCFFLRYDFFSLPHHVPVRRRVGIFPVLCWFGGEGGRLSTWCFGEGRVWRFRGLRPVFIVFFLVSSDGPKYAAEGGTRGGGCGGSGRFSRRLVVFSFSMFFCSVLAPLHWFLPEDFGFSEFASVTIDRRKI